MGKVLCVPHRAFHIYHGFAVAFANESLHHYSAETGRADLSERGDRRFLGSAAMIYDRLNLASLGLSPKAFDYALCGMEKLRDMGKLMNDQIIYDR